MADGRKESRLFHISVEGVNCEKMYFDHLASLINVSGCNKYNAKVICKKADPESFAKRNSYFGVEKIGKRQLPYLHIQDIEDYYDSGQQKRFYALLDEIRKTESEFGIQYKLGYSNFTFELWLLLHVADMNHALTDRYAYLQDINRYFNRHYATLDDFKKHDEFQTILDQFVTLDSVRSAIKRAEHIVAENKAGQKICEHYKNFSFFRDNPDVTVHDVVKIIFDVCGIEY